MSYWLGRLNSMLYAYDRELYAKQGYDGKVIVYRKAKTWESYVLDDGMALTYAKDSDHYIFALTDNWSMSGKVRHWGLEPVLSHLKEIDPWRDSSVCERVIEQHEKKLKERERSSKNKHEDLAHEMRGDFKKAFSDINTSTMNKNGR